MLLDQLRKYWDAFVRCPAARKQKKTQRLDKFLTTCAIVMKQASSRSNITQFAEMRGMSGILATVFMTDIHEICSSAKNDDDTSALRSYLLSGRGWLILEVQHWVGVHNISCAKDLAEVLVSLLPVCFKFAHKMPDTDKQDEISELDFSPLSDCFHHLTSSTKHKSDQIGRYTYISDYAVDSEIVTGLQKNSTGHLASKKRLSDSGHQMSDSDTEVEPERLIHLHRRRPQSRRAAESAFRKLTQECSVLPNLFSSESSDEGNEDQDEVYYRDLEEHAPLALCVRLLELTRQLCHTDVTVMPSLKSLSASILPNLTQRLSDLHTTNYSNPPEGWSYEHVIILGRMLLRVIISLSSYVSFQPNGTLVLADNGTVSTVLAVCRVVLNDFENDLVPKHKQVSINDQNMERALLFACESLESVLMLIQSIFNSLPQQVNIAHMKSALHLLEDFRKWRGFELIEYIINFYEKNNALCEQYRQQVASLIHGVSKIVLALKKTKVDYVHNVTCLKHRHRKCDFTQFRHHHHDILGITSSSYVSHQFAMSDGGGNLENQELDSHVKGPSKCAVAILSEFLMTLLSTVKTRFCHSHVLQCIEECGICCCVSPADVLTNMLKHLPSYPPRRRHHILTILVKLLLDQCGGSSASHRRPDPCPTCTSDNTTYSVEQGVEFDNRTTRTSDSALSSSEASLADNQRHNRSSKWQVMQTLYHLMQSTNENVAGQLAKHLLRLTSQASAPLKFQIFLHVIQPMLQLAERSRTPVIVGNPSAGASAKATTYNIQRKVVHYCLYGLPLILQSENCRKVFLHQRSISNLCHLMETETLRSTILQVFEVLILTSGSSVEGNQKHKMKQNVYLACDEDGVVQVCDVFLKHILLKDEPERLNTINTSCLNSDTKASNGLDNNQIEDLLSHNKDFQVNNQPVRIVSKVSDEQKTKCSSLTDIPTLLYHHDIWRTCYKMLASSDIYRRQFIEVFTGPDHAYKLLVELLKPEIIQTLLHDKRSHADEHFETSYQVALSLLESLLGVCLYCTSDGALFDSKLLTITKLLQSVSSFITSSMASDKEHIDMLLSHLCNCAVTCPIADDPLNMSSYAVLHLKEDDFNEDDEAVDSSDTASSSETQLTEFGYEADSECLVDDIKEGVSEHTKQLTVAAPSGTQLKLKYPQMCTFVLRILSDLPPPSRNELLIHTLQKLTTLAKSYSENVRLLYNEGIIETILTLFKDVFSTCPALGDMRVECELVLELFSVLAQYMISSRELGLYLKIFDKDNPPRMALLSSLLSLMQSAHIQPTHSVCFPVPGQVPPRPVLIEDRYPVLAMDSLTTSLRTQDAVRLEEFGYVTSETNIPKSTLNIYCNTASSAVSEASSSSDGSQIASHIAPLNVGLEELIWNNNVHRFSLSMWMCLQTNKDFNKSSTQPKFKRKNLAFKDPFENVTRPDLKKSKSLIDSCLHVISLGSMEFTVEFWVDLTTGSLVIRLVHVNDSKEQQCLWEHLVPRILHCDKWQHLVVNYEDRVEKTKAGGKIAFMLNGLQSHEVSPFYVLSSKSKSPVLLYLGHSGVEKEASLCPGTWKVGNIMLFRDCVISKEVAFHLYCLGPSCSTLSACDSSELNAIYKYHISEDLLLKSHIMHDMLTGNMNVPLDAVRESLALVYNPKEAMQFNIYPNIRGSATSPRAFPGILAGFTQKKPAIKLTLQQPVPVVIDGWTEIKNEERVSWEMAVDQSGGVGVFLFLFAKVVETSHCEVEQAKSLQLLFSLLRHSPKHAHDFDMMSSYSMVKKVLMSSRCILGYQILKVLTDACCSEQVIKFNRSTKMWRLLSDTEAIIQDVNIITELLLAWKVWEKTGVEVWYLAFQVLEVLIREDHPHCAFNMHQMICGRVMERLLVTCQERIQDGLPSLPTPICDIIIRMVQRMLGSPPDINLVAAICDFLLVVHPAASTYVVNTPKKFYSSQHWGDELAKPEVNIKVLEKILLASVPTSSTPSKKLSNQKRMERTDAGNLNTSRSLPNSPSAARKVLTHDDSRISGRSPLKIVTSTNPEPLPSDQISPIAHNEQEEPTWFLSDDDDVCNGYDSVVSGIGEEDVSVAMMPHKNGVRESGTKVKVMSDESEEWEIVPNSDFVPAEGLFDFVDENEKGLVIICSELLNLIAGVVINLPDNLLSKLLGIVLRPETLIVLSNHESVQLRTAIVKLLDVYLHRAEISLPEKVDQYVKLQGFLLLANQLHQFSSNRELIEACFTMVFGKPHCLCDDCDPNMLTEVSEVRQLAIIPVMALLEGIVSKPTLCHNTLCLLCQVFELVPALATVMVDNGLVETLCNVIHAIAKHHTKPVSHGVVDPYEVLVGDITHLLSLITSRALGTTGAAAYQQFEDMMRLLNALEQVHIGLHANQMMESYARSVDVVCQLQCLVMQSGLEFIQTTCELNIIRRRTSIMHTLLLREKTRATDFRRSVSTSAVRDQLMSYKRKDPFLTISETERLAQRRRGSLYSCPPATLRPVSPYDQFCLNEDEQELNRETLTIDPSRRHSSVFYQQSSVSNQSQTSDNELAERYRKVVTMSVDFVIFSGDLHSSQSTVEDKLARLCEDGDSCVPETFVYKKQFERHLLDSLLNSLLTAMEKPRSNESVWNSLLRGSRDFLRIQFSRLLTHVLRPSSSLDQRLYAVQLVTTSKSPKLPDLMKLMGNTGCTGQRLNACLRDMVTNHYAGLRPQQKEMIDGFLPHLKAYGPMLANEDDMKAWQAETERQRQSWAEKRAVCVQRVLQKSEVTTRQISVNAMEVTQNVVKNQNRERKKFIEHLKVKMTHSLQVKKQWQQLIQQLTHERAVWHDPKSYPQSWQLDPTEGPCRVRKRLQRCHLGISAEKLKSEAQHKLESEERESPLSYLFDDDHQTSDSAALIYRLHTNEKIELTCRSMSVTPSSEIPGDLLIGENSMYFIGDEAIMDANYTQLLLGNKDDLSMNWPLEEIKEIHKRWYQLNDNAIEIFLTNGKTCLLALESTKERDVVYTHLMGKALPNLLKVENLSAIQQLWLEGKMTNFEYLTHLNKVAGRSFNDLMQYPVFPFVLKEYTSTLIDLESPQMYRDLTKPISVQEKAREEKYVSNYNFLVSEASKVDPAVLRVSPFHMAPYHYGSHYSNSGSVLHFLVRLPPFTKMFLSYQDGHFDIPDRTFHSLATTYRLSSYESTTDVKELIPEFFFLPEFLLNSEGFDFKKRQCGNPVEDVELPPWCSNNPRLFTLVHRQALESAYVSSMIHHWIDLVFGFKQQGKPAVDAINVFHPATYFGIDVDAIEDPVKRGAVKTMIKTYGQTPKQLFRSPHDICRFPGGRETVRTVPDNDASKNNPVVPGVSGLKWGNYVGSPDCDPPMVSWREDFGSSVSSVVALPTGEVFGLGPDSCLLVMYSKEKGVVAINTTDVIWASIVSWGHPDNILRIKNKKDLPPTNFIHWTSEEKVTCCASVPDCKRLFIGGTSGVITVFNTRFLSSKQSELQVTSCRQCLYGHNGPIRALQVCKPYSILVSASDDGTCIVWDLNRLSYVNSICSHSSPVTALAVSDTSGDIATVSQISINQSLLCLHTVNAKLVKSIVNADHILCLTFSGAQEGRSINVIAGGLENGVIRLWNSWTLAPVLDLNDPFINSPIVSLTFSHDSQRLFIADSKGLVAAWENQCPTKVQTLKRLNVF